MTSYDTGTTGCSLVEADRYLPLAEPWNFLFDEFWLVSSVGIVTGLAGAAFIDFVHMQVVKIAVAITKVGQAVRPLVQNHLGCMAVKTKRKIFGAERQIKIFGEILLQVLTVR